MKKIGFAFLALTLTGAALAANDRTVAVTGDRVSLRAAPKLTAVLLTRTALNDSLVLVDNSNPKWVGVRPPDTVDFWINGDYVQEGVVLPAQLNIRSGPSLSHEVVGVVQRGDKLTIRGTLRDWIRIAPPAETTAWISRKYTDLKGKEEPVSSEEPVLITVDPAEPVVSKEPVIQIIVESPKVIVAEVIESVEAPVVELPKVVVADVVEPIETNEDGTKTVMLPVFNEILIAGSDMAELPEALAPDSTKEQGVLGTFSGVLQPASAILYKLVDPTLEPTVVCYVRGNLEQMGAYVGSSLTLSGPTYWAAGLDKPFLVPEQIKVLQK
jgi:uncharacterized protein YgiM (DUF1202 family)